MILYSCLRKNPDDSRAAEVDLEDNNGARTDREVRDIILADQLKGIASFEPDQRDQWRSERGDAKVGESLRINISAESSPP